MSATPMSEASLDIVLGTFKRVTRGLTPKGGIVETFRSLRRGEYDDLDALEETHRRQLLDLPNLDDEDDMRGRVTSLSRQELLAKAAGDPVNLTDAELKFLSSRTWGSETSEEFAATDEAISAVCDIEQAGPDDPSPYDMVLQQILTLQKPLFKDNEEEAFSNAETERWERIGRASRASQKVRAENALDRALPWVRQRYDYHETHPGHVWGYVCFKDAWMQSLTEQEAEEFDVRMSAVLQYINTNTGVMGSLSQLWRLPYVNGPAQGKLFATDDEAFSDGLGGERLADIEESIESTRRIFRSLRTQAGDQTSTQDGQSGVKLLEPGMLESTFLVVDETCYKSVVSDGHGPRLVDDMFILAVDADYTASDTRTLDGNNTKAQYRGYMRVRLQQIVNRFFALRWLRADTAHMGDLWQAAQNTRNQAFASLDMEEASNFLPSAISGSLNDVEPDPVGPGGSIG